MSSEGPAPALTNQAPILLVKTYPEELGRKPGGGEPPKPPLVPVDEVFRASLASQVDAVFDVARNAPAMIQAAGVPVAVQLRSEAYAKSNRPYNFLDSAGVDVVGGANLGVLIARAPISALTALKAGVLQRERPQDVRELSTIERLHAWRPLVEAVGADAESTGRAKLDRIVRESEFLSLELFPWLSPTSEITENLSIASFLRMVGLDVVAESHSRRRPCLFLRPTDDFAGESLKNLLGIRAVYPTPRYATVTTSVGVTSSGGSALPVPPAGLPTVGVLDSGTAPSVASWITGQSMYDLPGDRNPMHGTFVAGLVAGSRHLNDDDSRFPADQALVYDAQVLPSGTIPQHELEARISEAVDLHSDTIPVWNCSFAAVDAHPESTYTPFAAFMDELSESKNVVFVQAAGNYGGTPRRQWPPQTGLSDGLASPAEAVRSITVGSLAHREGSVVPNGKPASYSRRGPGVAGLIKPDVCFWSGDFDSNGSAADTGVASLDPWTSRIRMVGTSFATPIVSAVTANLAASVSAEDLQGADRATLFKAMLVHSARLGPMEIDDEHRIYYGHGVPAQSSEILTDTSETFTTLYHTQFMTAGEWIKEDIAIPDCLVVDDKLRAHICMTVSHNAIINPAYDDECVRTSVQSSLGPQSVGKRGRANIRGMVPPEDSLQGWEVEQIEGGKWSPVRSHRKSWSRGTEIKGPWGIKVSLLERLETISRPVDVVVIVTFRGLEPGLPVRSDGVRALAARNHATQEVVTRARLRVVGGL